MLVGYHINPGGVSPGDYYVLDLETIREHYDQMAKHVKARRVREIVIPPGEVSFPFKEGIVSNLGGRPPTVDAGHSDPRDGPPRGPDNDPEDHVPSVAPQGGVPNEQVGGSSSSTATRICGGF